MKKSGIVSSRYVVSMAMVMELSIMVAMIAMLKVVDYIIDK
jgi:hypothetical protein